MKDHPLQWTINHVTSSELDLQGDLSRRVTLHLYTSKWPLYSGLSGGCYYAWISILVPLRLMRGVGLETLGSCVLTMASIRDPLKFIGNLDCGQERTKALKWKLFLLTESMTDFLPKLICTLQDSMSIHCQKNIRKKVIEFTKGMRKMGKKTRGICIPWHNITKETGKIEKYLAKIEWKIK